MTRFKELKRIEIAIEHKNLADLRWAISYCRARKRIALRKDHQKYWRRMEKRVTRALDENGGDSN